MADNNASPISDAEPAKANPLANPATAHASTLKLRPIVRPSAESSSPAAESPVEALKNITRNLKGVTTAIPPQAILHKTGIIADPGLSEAQKQAMKSKTSRISLNDAMGAAPVKDESAPMKTIRIKRPTNLGAEAPAAPAPAGEAPVNVTQRKTLKISRPTAKLKKPGVAAPAPEAPAEAAASADDAVADIPEMPVTAAPVAAVADTEGGSPVGYALMSAAACIAVGFAGWVLWTCFGTPLY